MNKLLILPTILFVLHSSLDAQIIKVPSNVDQANLLCEEFCDVNNAPIQFDYPGQQGGQFYFQLFAARMCVDQATNTATGGFLEIYPGTSGLGFDLITHQVVVHDADGVPEVISVVSNLDSGDPINSSSNFDDGYVMHYDGHVSLDGTLPTLTNGYDDWSWTSGSLGFKMNVYGDIHFGYMNLTIVGGNNTTGFIVEVDEIYIEQTPDHGIAVGDVPYCTSDINQSGNTDIQDLIMLNSQFGNTCSGCPEDVDGDGYVGVGDFLLLNSSFGSSCD